MNHDYAHCLDYTPDCPKDCFRAKLAKDLIKQLDQPWKRYVWVHLLGTGECMRKEVTE